MMANLNIYKSFWGLSDLVNYGDFNLSLLTNPILLSWSIMCPYSPIFFEFANRKFRFCHSSLSSIGIIPILTHVSQTPILLEAGENTGNLLKPTEACKLRVISCEKSKKNKTNFFLVFLTWKVKSIIFFFLTFFWWFLTIFWLLRN